MFNKQTKEVALMNNLKQLKGIHHVTAITSSAKDIYKFYTNILGLRLVKKNVNQDDLKTYHLFFADDRGNPGTDMTFFDFKGISQAVHGNNEISETGFRVPNDKALEYWLKRLNHYNVTNEGISTLFGKNILRFRDFDDQRYVIFSDELDIANIKKNFLERLVTKIDSDESGKIQRKPITEENIISIGKKLKKEHEFKGEDYKIGLEHITIELEQILEILDEQDVFKSKYILLSPTDEDLSKISWEGRDHIIRKTIVKSCNAFFTSNKSSIEWALGKKTETVEKHLEEFGLLKPCVHGSDAHDYDKLFKPDENRFCWIKAKPTFEGLLQILY